MMEMEDDFARREGDAASSLHGAGFALSLRCDALRDHWRLSIRLESQCSGPLIDFPRTRPFLRSTIHYPGAAPLSAFSVDEAEESRLLC